MSPLGHRTTPHPETLPSVATPSMVVPEGRVRVQRPLLTGYSFFTRLSVDGRGGSCSWSGDRKAGTPAEASSVARESSSCSTDGESSSVSLAEARSTSLRTPKSAARAATEQSGTMKTRVLLPGSLFISHSSRMPGCAFGQSRRLQRPCRKRLHTRRFTVSFGGFDTVEADEDEGDSKPSSMSSKRCGSTPAGSCRC
eukprot:scaffold4178_cov257-Pinguiococcus_pyrenoidosus.AAC.7